MNNFPKIHNATWPGLVGKGPDSEPVISLDQMLKMTAAAEVDGIKFDGVDLGLLGPHFDIESGKDGAKAMADKVASYNLQIGSLVAPIWAGSAMGDQSARDTFVDMVKKTCEAAAYWNETGIRTSGVVRIDSAAGVGDWAKDPKGNSKQIVETFQRACDVAKDYGEKLAIEGEICWGGIHSWKHVIEILEAVDRPNIGFQADMSHTLLYTMGYNAPEHRILPENYDWKDRSVLTSALKTLTDALRPWTIDFHVAQNDGTVHGTGSHDKTGRHCQANDPNGKLNVVEDAGLWLRDGNGQLTKAFKHICWDGCMFSNEVMMKQETWNNILGMLIKVRNAHGWN
ncbi:sugar phosphate isomerase/epimerase [Sandaracinomonas limnophila]|uniref:Sugar phosphate isomerase/epimerase n=1 Tax=Sandaracinomonas limnophila TaxID=1862386 RepID=A0A437PMK0_9BACT|nr:TIM barrel protein [Sandaracinomonas limnophila]RVU23399.1 sugar phosphate isomerase/epimerase [Sandaracinomonas limnophila]